MTVHAIEIESLQKEFRLGFFRRKVEAVKDVSLQVKSGEIFGFLGPNGAGKTTTIKTLMGLIYPTKGSVKIFGHSADNIQAKKRLGFLPQNPNFYGYLTGKEFLDFYGRLFPMSSDTRQERVNRLFEQVGLSHAVDIPIRKYSGGMIQRVGIAQALINDPDLVILDEPMSGLDPLGRKDVRDIIYYLKDLGKTVFFSSHILQDVEMICDRVAIMIDGTLRKVGPLQELLQTTENIQYEMSFSKIDEALKEKFLEMGSLVRSKKSQLTVQVSSEKKDQALQLLLSSTAHLESLTPLKGTLEDLFVQQVRDKDK